MILSENRFHPRIKSGACFSGSCARAASRRLSLPTALIAIDQGTTSTRAIVFDAALAAARQRAAGAAPDLSGAGLGRARPGGNLGGDGRDRARRHGEGRACGQGYRRHRHHQSARDHRRLGPRHRPSRSTMPSSGRTGAPPIFAMRCARAGHEPEIAAKTGLLLDPYFSASKIAWLLEHVTGARAVAEAGRLAFGTIDCFLLWRLTGGKVHATDATNAARTLLFDIARGQWDEGAVPDVRRAGIACCRRCATARLSSAQPRPNCSARPSAFSAWPATSRRRRSGRAASSPA